MASVTVIGALAPFVLAAIAPACSPDPAAGSHTDAPAEQQAGVPQEGVPQGREDSGRESDDGQGGAHERELPAEALRFERYPQPVVPLLFNLQEESDAFGSRFHVRAARPGIPAGPPAPAPRAPELLPIEVAAVETTFEDGRSTRARRAGRALSALPVENRPAQRRTSTALDNATGDEATRRELEAMRLGRDGSRADPLERVSPDATTVFVAPARTDLEWLGPEMRAGVRPVMEFGVQAWETDRINMDVSLGVGVELFGGAQEQRPVRAMFEYYEGPWARDYRYDESMRYFGVSVGWRF